jgi:hypothetical protein
MSTLRRRIDALERAQPERWEVFEYWCQYGDAYHRALVRGGDKQAALDELKQQLSPYWVEQVVWFCEAAVEDHARNCGKRRGS